MYENPKPNSHVRKLSTKYPCTFFSLYRHTIKDGSKVVLLIYYFKIFFASFQGKENLIITDCTPKNCVNLNIFRKYEKIFKLQNYYSSNYLHNNNINHTIHPIFCLLYFNFWKFCLFRGLKPINITFKFPL